MARSSRFAAAGFTTRATCLIAAGLTAILCGVAFGEVDLVRAGALAVAVPAVAAVVVHRSQVRIANRRGVEPGQVRAGDPVTVHLTITNRSALPTGALMLEDRLPDRVPGRARFVIDPLAGHEARPVSYRIPGLGRGRYLVGPLRMRLTDPFRLIDLTRSFSATSEFLVAPVVEPLGTGEPPRSDDIGDNVGSRSIGTHGADDQSTREYRQGDDLRKIHWRSSARTGSLMVRQEERPWQGHTTLLLDVRGTAHVESRLPGGGTASADGSDGSTGSDGDPRTTSSFEWAVSAAASIGTHLLLADRRLGLVADAAGERLPFADPSRLSSHLADVSESRRADLSPAAGLLRSAGRDSTLIVVLGRLDPVGLRQVADAHARGRSTPAFALLLDVDSWAAAPGGHPHGSTGSAGRTTGRRLVDAEADVLRSAGWRVVVVRRGDSVRQAWQLLTAGWLAGGPAAATGATR